MGPMFSPVDPADYSKVRRLFDNENTHLAPLAVLSCNASGTVYADNPADPCAALVRVGHRLHLAGIPNIPEFNLGLRRLLTEELPAQKTGAEDMFMFYYAHAGWESAIDGLLKGRYPLKGNRHVYTFRGFRQGWRQSLPEGFEVHRVKPQLLANKNMKHVQDLTEEILSETSSQEEFFKNRFGVCITHLDEIACWCLSEYNCIEGCEVGIATVPEHQRKGLATVAASALVEKAHAHGISRIGWHCWADNKPSVATAIAAGFELDQEYQVVYGWFNQSTNLAANGNAHLWEGQYREAASWYERAINAGDPPGWAYWNAACASAEIGQPEKALGYLRMAFKKDYGSLEDLLASKHLKSLHQTDEWHEIVSILAED